MELVEDDGFLFRGSFLITEKDRLEVFLFRWWTHNPNSFPPSISGNIYYESTIRFYKRHLLNTARLCWADENRFAEDEMF